MAVLDHAASETDQIVRRLVPDPKSHYGLLRLQFVRRFEREIRKIVRRVLAVARLAADHQRLPHRISGERRRVPVVSDFIYLARFEVHAFYHLESFFSRDVLFIDHVFLVVRPHVLVEPAESARRRAHFDVEAHVDEPYGLERLHERLRRVFRNDPAVLGDREEFLFPLFVFALSRLSFRFIRHAVSVRDQSFRLDDARFPEIDFFLLFSRLREDGVDVPLTLLDVSSHPDLQDFFVVACRLSGNAVLKTDAQYVVAFEILYVLRHDAVGEILHRFSFPVFQGLKDDLPVFGGNVVWVFRPR